MLNQNNRLNQHCLVHVYASFDLLSLKKNTWDVMATK